MNPLRWLVMLVLGLSGTATVKPVASEIVFRASSPGVQLAGTITQPASAAPRAALVLLSVAGPTDRDLTIGRHRLYDGLAARLSDAGVASLRFDARGVGASSGDLLATTFDDRVADACLALAALRDRLGPSVPTGFLGMSEGAGIALAAAEQCGPVPFTVLLSAPVRRGTVEIEAQFARLIASSALPETTREAVADLGRRFLAIAADSEPERHRSAIQEILAGPYGPAILPPYAFVPQDVAGRVDFVLSRWYRSQLHYDVERAVTQGRAATLALYGSLDRVLDPSANAARLAQLRPAAQVEVITGLNHLLQEARTGSPLEYGQLPEGVSSSVVTRVVAFVVGRAE